MRITASGAARWVRGFLGEWRTVLRITGTSVRARTQYRGDFVTALVYGPVWQTSVFVFASVLLTRFPGLGGWTLGGVLLIVAIRMLSHGANVLRGTCPNCGGELVRRPIRPARLLAVDPPSTRRVIRPGCAPAASGSP